MCSERHFCGILKVDEKKKCLLMLNKADYLSASQRNYWRQYFHSLNIEVLYFSAIREEIRLKLTTKANRDQLSEDRKAQIMENLNGADDDKEMLSVDRLIDIFGRFQGELGLEQIEVGMIGYPNVGKSTVINVLMGAKRVSTGSTPGKTKHFQTLCLTDTVTLCDCPGLVFPTLCSSKADMVLNGCIPVDNLTDFISPSRLLVHRISTQQLNRYVLSLSVFLSVSNSEIIHFVGSRNFVIWQCTECTNCDYRRTRNVPVC